MIHDYGSKVVSVEEEHKLQKEKEEEEDKP